MFWVCPSPRKGDSLDCDTNRASLSDSFVKLTTKEIVFLDIHSGKITSAFTLVHYHYCFPRFRQSQTDGL